MCKQRKKKLTGVLLALTAALAIGVGMPAAVKAEGTTLAQATEDISGVLGYEQGITWTYSAQTKTLTVSGEDVLVTDAYGWDSPFTSVKEQLEEQELEIERIVFQNCKLKGSARYLLHYMSDVQEIDLSGLDTSEVTDMSGMFSGCERVKTLDLGSLDTGKVTTMEGMFEGCERMTNLILKGLDTSSVTTMKSMFYRCYNLIRLDLSSFDTSQVYSMQDMFAGCHALQSLNVDNFDTENVTNMSGMFSNCYGLTSLDLSHFATGNATHMSKMFKNCSNLTELDAGCLDLSRCYSWGAEEMFSGCKRLNRLKAPEDMGSFSVELPYSYYAEEDDESMRTEYTTLSSANEGKTLIRIRPTTGTLGTNGNIRWSYDGDTRTLTLSGEDELYGTWKSGVGFGNTMNAFGDINDYLIERVVFSDCKLTGKADYLFWGMEGIKEIDCTGLDTSEVTSMEEMFARCSGLKSICFGDHFVLDAQPEISGIFAWCTALEELDLSSWELGSGFYNVYDIVKECASLKQFQTPKLLSRTIELPNAFYDAAAPECKYNEKISASEAGKTLKRIETDWIPYELKWESGKATWKMDGSGKDVHYVLNFYGSRVGTNEKWHGMTTSGGTDCTQDFTEHIEEECGSGQYWFKVRAYVRNEDGTETYGLWSDYSEILEYYRPDDSLESPKLTLHGTQGSVTFPAVEGAAAYRVNLRIIREDGTQKLVKVNYDPWYTEEIPVYDISDGDGYGWTDDSRTELVVDVGRRFDRNFWSEYEDCQFYIEVCALSEDINAYVSSKSRTENFLYKDRGDQPVTAAPENVRWDERFMARWTYDARIQSYEVELRNDTTGDMIYSYADNGYAMGDWVQPFADVINESGSYSFRVRANRAYVDDNGWETEELEDAAWSEWMPVSYTRPAAALGVTTITAGESPYIVSFTPVDGAVAYLVRVRYKIKSGYGYAVSYRTIRRIGAPDDEWADVKWADDAHTAIIADESWVERGGITEVWFEITAVSPDIAKIASSITESEHQEVESLGSINVCVHVKDGDAAGVALCLKDEDGSVAGEHVFEDGNCYDFLRLPDGDYTLSISKESYVTRNQEIPMEGDSISIDLDLYHPGDIDGNGSSDVSDLNLMCEHIRGSRTLTGYALDCADVDGEDGKVDVTDLNRLCQHIRGSDLLWK